MLRKKIIAGNWKMNATKEEAVALLNGITECYEEYHLSEQKNVMVAAPFPYIHYVASVLSKFPFMFAAAQNCSEYEQGAYTGEVSAKIIASLDVPYILIGHSERRQYFNESDEVLLQKILQVQKQHLTPVFCCGESLEIAAIACVENQLNGFLNRLTKEQATQIVIAYEPIWAIGTGKVPSMQDVQQMHASVRGQVRSILGADAADSMRIIYGGSCNAENAKSLFSLPDVDGGLIGGASLDASTFKAIISEA